MVLLSLSTTPSTLDHATLHTQEEKHTNPCFVIAAFVITAHVFLLALRTFPNTTDETRAGLAHLRTMVLCPTKSLPPRPLPLI